MKVLVDRHHAGLFHSMQLLFDRLGGTVYTPMGHDWWDAGYWRFGEGTYPDDRLAQQFLNTAQFEDGVTYDPEFPDRVIRGVLLDDAIGADSWDAGWDYVVATLQDNQHGFARFARETGAKFVLAVGNTGQLIDWGLDPIVLNSSEMPLLGRGVNIGQEFDSDGIFARAPISNALRIGSFANVMPQMPCWPLLDYARKTAQDLDFRVHGIDGPDGNVKPIDAIANVMRGCGWGWHDKTHGDGFGHVIHYWAAMGRPLIGHASHYRGKRAEPLWEDGVTAIDLDKHHIDEALDMVRSISSEPRVHNDMSVAIRRRFDELCDWDRDAKAVADVLGIRAVETLPESNRPRPVLETGLLQGVGSDAAESMA
jgi:hypothetical protein